MMCCLLPCFTLLEWFCFRCVVLNKIFTSLLYKNIQYQDWDWDYLLIDRLCLCWRWLAYDSYAIPSNRAVALHRLYIESSYWNAVTTEPASRANALSIMPWRRKACKRWFLLLKAPDHCHARKYLKISWGFSFSVFFACKHSNFNYNLGGS